MINRIIGLRRGSKVHLHEEVPSPSDPTKRSMLSDSLEGLADFDLIWYLMRTTCMTQRPMDLVTHFEVVMHVPFASDAIVKEIMSGVPGSPDEDLELHTHIRYDKSKGLIVTQKYDNRRKRLAKHVYQLHEKGLFLEMWQERPAERR